MYENLYVTVFFGIMFIGVGLVLGLQHIFNITIPNPTRSIITASLVILAFLVATTIQFIHTANKLYGYIIGMTFIIIIIIVVLSTDSSSSIPVIYAVGIVAVPLIYSSIIHLLAKFNKNEHLIDGLNIGVLQGGLALLAAIIVALY